MLPATAKLLRDGVTLMVRGAYNLFVVVGVARIGGTRPCLEHTSKRMVRQYIGSRVTRWIWGVDCRHNGNTSTVGVFFTKAGTINDGSNESLEHL